jgi:hypothetical protein
VAHGLLSVPNPTRDIVVRDALRGIWRRVDVTQCQAGALRLGEGIGIEQAEGFTLCAQLQGGDACDFEDLKLVAGAFAILNLEGLKAHLVTQVQQKKIKSALERVCVRCKAASPAQMLKGSTGRPIWNGPCCQIGWLPPPDKILPLTAEP